ncbi:MAG: diguanylate cyclase [Xanthomonadales bacterium PRO7]|nr:diguanylate cyclase [Xanthomonadales bacterium PRO7]
MATLKPDSNAQPPYKPAFFTRLSVLFAITAALLLTLSVFIWHTLDRLVAENEWVTHTYEVMERTEAVISRLRAMQADAIAYAATGDVARRGEFEDMAPLLDAELNALADLVRDNAVQARRMADFTASIRQEQSESLQLVQDRRKSGSRPSEMPDIGLAKIRGLSAGILAEENRLLNERNLDSARSALITRSIAAAALLVSLLALALAYWLVLRSHREELRARAGLNEANLRLNQSLADARDMSETMSKLATFGELLHGCQTLDEVREGIGKSLGGLLPQLGGRMALINPSQNLASIGAHWGRHGLLAESVFAPEDCWALRRGQAYPLAGTTPSFSCKHVQWPNPDCPGAGYLCVPLAAHNEMIGVLTFDGERAPTADERRIALAAAEQLSLALANLRLKETLRTQSIRDPLTGLFNRRYLEVSLERELQRSARRSQTLAVLMLDIDHFKRFNDSHGHEAGDALLAQFAEVLQRAARSEDIACRYGGEEFTVILLEADAATAQRRAETIRQATADMSVTYRQQQLPHVTVSIGLAVYPRDAQTPAELLRRADAALYLAKKAGRNRVATAEAEADA